MTAGFRVTVEDLASGKAQSMVVYEGDYMLIPFAPCHLTHAQRSSNGTVQITLKDHAPRRPARVEASSEAGSS